MMQILLAAATMPEIQPTIDFLQKKEFRLGPHKIRLLITGVGLVPTAYSLMKEVFLFGLDSSDRAKHPDRPDKADRPGLILQAGIAGCFTIRQPGEVMVIKEEVLDMGVWEAGCFHNLFDLRLAGPDIPPFSGGKLLNPYKKLIQLSALEPVSSISVNEITTDPARIRWLQQNGSPVVESMEGGALHYVCLQEGFPFLQLRSVSNEVGVRDKIKWNIPAAIRELNKKLAGLLNDLAGQDETILERQA